MSSAAHNLANGFANGKPEEADSQTVREIRKLVIDICRQNGGGHGGSAIGMAPLAVALWKYAMRYNPTNPHVRYKVSLAE